MTAHLALYSAELSSSNPFNFPQLSSQSKNQDVNLGRQRRGFSELLLDQNHVKHLPGVVLFHEGSSSFFSQNFES